MNLHFQPAPGNVRSADDLQEIANRVNALHAQGEQATREGLARFRDAGRALLEAKAKCGHGNWLPWLRANVRFSERTAQDYMRLARNWEKSAVAADLRGALRVLTEDDPAEQSDPEPDAGRFGYGAAAGPSAEQVAGEHWANERRRDREAEAAAVTPAPAQTGLRKSPLRLGRFESDRETIDRRLKQLREVRDYVAELCESPAGAALRDSGAVVQFVQDRDQQGTRRATRWGFPGLNASITALESFAPERECAACRGDCCEACHGFGFEPAGGFPKSDAGKRDLFPGVAPFDCEPTAGEVGRAAA